jgi:hypothetical protein
MTCKLEYRRNSPVAGGEKTFKIMACSRQVSMQTSPRGEKLRSKEETMLLKRTSSTAFAAALTLGLMIAPCQLTQKSRSAGSTAAKQTTDKIA